MDGPTLRLLGGFSLADAGGREVALPGRKTRMLLAYLALNAARPVPRERLAGLLWPDRDERSARHCLRQGLTELRRLGERAGRPDPDRRRHGRHGAAGRAGGRSRRRAAGPGGHPRRPARRRRPVRRAAPAGEETGSDDFDTWLSGERARVARIAGGVFARLTALCEERGLGRRRLGGRALAGPGSRLRGGAPQPDAGPCAGRAAFGGDPAIPRLRRGGAPPARRRAGGADRGAAAQHPRPGLGLAGGSPAGGILRAGAPGASGQAVAGGPALRDAGRTGRRRGSPTASPTTS